MKEIWISLILIICTYFSLICAIGVDIKYSNKWMVHVPFGEIADREVARSNNMTYEESVPTVFQETIKPWSYRDTTHSSCVSKSLLLRNNYKKAFNDDRWSDMWYLQNFRSERTQPVLDINVVPVHYKLGITGNNVNIAVVDNGVNWKHPEISQKFNHDISWNYIDNSNDITPSYNEKGELQSHGTKCTGIIIMKPNNNVCGVGIAYGSRVGAIKILDDEMTAKRKSKGLNHALKYVDIYSNSWGPCDDGDVMDTIDELVESAIYTGVTQGRGGKGAIYLFPSGNGRIDNDNCACDCYANDIHTITVAACDDSGHPTYYSERCAAVMVTTYGGDGREANVLTTDVDGQCTDSFFGTSAATPIVAAVVGLAISANPNLTWRDIFHLLAWTCQVAPLSDNFGWNRNKAGFYYSLDFGFGLINAYKLVREAKKWKNVPKMKSCGIRMPKVKRVPVSRSSGARIIVESTGCKGSYNEVKFIEQIQLMVTMTYPKRGDIQIAMKSAAGTEVHVFDSRIKDLNSDGLQRWSFLILAFWGESPKGNFVIDIYDKTGSSSNEGKIKEMALVIHGTKEAPNAYRNGPRPYENFKLASSEDKPNYFKLSSLRKQYLQLLKERKSKHSNGNAQNVNHPISQTNNEYQQYYQNLANYNAYYSRYPNNMHYAVLTQG